MASSDALIRLIITASANEARAYRAAQAGRLPVDVIDQLNRIDRQGLAR